MTQQPTAEQKDRSAVAELTRDAQIRTIARDVLKVQLRHFEHDGLRDATVYLYDIRHALNAAFAAGMDFQRKQVQNAE